MDTEVLVYVDLESIPIFVGQSWARTLKSQDRAAFEDGCLSFADRFLFGALVA